MSTRVMVNIEAFLRILRTNFKKFPILVLSGDKPGISKLTTEPSVAQCTSSQAQNVKTIKVLLLLLVVSKRRKGASSFMVPYSTYMGKLNHRIEKISRSSY